MQDVHTALYNAMYSVYNALYSAGVYSALYILHCTVVQCTALYNAVYTLYNSLYKVHVILCPVLSLKTLSDNKTLSW